MKNVNEKKNIHIGHRKRLVELACNVGLDNLSDVQVVELFLTYIFPRTDVNPLAHELLDRYQNLCNIVSATPEGLSEVPGINKASAQRICVFGELFYYFVTSRISKKHPISNVAELIDVVEDYLRLRDVENILLLALSAGNIITHRKRIGNGTSKEISILLIDIANFIRDSKAASIVIAHSHPYGSCIPSKSDDNSFNEINNLCINFGINLIDSYIVGEDGVYSHRKNDIIRKYCDIEGLTDTFKLLIK